MAIIHFVFGNKNGNELLLMMYGGLGVVLGHNFHFTLILREERELLRHRGIVLGLLFYPTHCWAFAVLGALTFGLVTYFSKYVSLGSLLWESACGLLNS